MTQNQIDGDGYFGPDANQMRERDNRICTSCHHKNISHSSYAKGVFMGVGFGACGMCPCASFTGPPIYETFSDHFTAEKELDRHEAIEAAQMTPNHLWTVVEGDGCDCEDEAAERCSCPENELFTSPGFHYVNAVQWFLSTEEWRDQDLHRTFIFDGMEQ